MLLEFCHINIWKRNSFLHLINRNESESADSLSSRSPAGGALIPLISSCSSNTKMDPQTEMFLILIFKLYRAYHHYNKLCWHWNATLNICRQARMILQPDHIKCSESQVQSCFRLAVFIRLLNNLLETV